MIANILAIDLVLYLLLAIWVAVVHVFGSSDAKGGAGFVAFVLGMLIAGATVLAVTVIIIFNAIFY